MQQQMSCAPSPCTYNITQSFFNNALFYDLFIYFLNNTQEKSKYISVGEQCCDKLSLGEIGLSHKMRGNLFLWLFATVIIVWNGPIHLNACLLSLPLCVPLFPYLTCFDSVQLIQHRA